MLVNLFLFLVVCYVLSYRGQKLFDVIVVDVLMDDGIYVLVILSVHDRFDQYAFFFAPVTRVGRVVTP